MFCIVKLPLQTCINFFFFFYHFDILIFFSFCLPCKNLPQFFSPLHFFTRLHQFSCASFGTCECDTKHYTEMRLSKNKKQNKNRKMNLRSYRDKRPHPYVYVIALEKFLIYK